MKIADPIRKQVRRLMHQVAKSINWIGNGRIEANHVTWASLILHVPIALAVLNQSYGLAALMLLIFGLLDAVDGELSRIQKKSSNYGVFLDSTTDRIKESLIYMPLIYIFADSARPGAALVASVALSGALITSYVSARGQSVLLDTKKTASQANQMFRYGLAGLEIRMSIMVIGFALSKPLEAVALVAVLSWLTVVARMMAVRASIK